MRKIISMLFAVAMVFGFISNANAAKTLKCQTVLNTKADEVKMLKDFTDLSLIHISEPTRRS